jgi:hypothetical protein
MAGSRFLVVEFFAPNLPLTGFTARYPGATIDMMSEVVAEHDGRRWHPSVVLVKGASPMAVRELAATVKEIYGPVRTLEEDPFKGLWLFRTEIPEDKLTGGAHILTDFQHRYGVPWTHMDEGILHMRAKINEPADGDVLADQTRRFLAQAGVEAQVEVQEMSTRDYGVWRDLIQHTIGMAS